MGRYWLPMASLAVALSCGCTSYRGERGTAGDGSVAPAKTLLNWTVNAAPVEESPTELEGRDPVEEPDEPLATDRPDFTEASSTVGRGRVQLETGYTYAYDRDGSARRTAHSYPEALLRVGVLADWLELRFGHSFGAEMSHSGGPVTRTSGGDDLYLGTKLALTEQSGVWPESALVIQSTVPTARHGRTAGAVLPGMNYLFGWDVIDDALTFAGSVQGNMAKDNLDETYFEVAQSLTAGYTLAPKVGAYTEWFAFYPAGSTDPDTGPEYYLNGGLTYRLNNDIQFDMRAGFGLNRRADDFFAGTGFAIRY